MLHWVSSDDEMTRANINISLPFLGPIQQSKTSNDVYPQQSQHLQNE